jgi:hypothetical protein
LRGRDSARATPKGRGEEQGGGPAVQRTLETPYKASHMKTLLGSGL